MQDKQVPCRIAGCENTWTWFAAQQIRGFGQPPPDRMCDEHLGQFNELADREVPCRTPGCPNTWTWKRGAQLAEMQRTGKLRRPSRLCAECFNAERETHDVELPCKIDGCRRSWTWTRDAQLRHRLWVLRQRAKAARPNRPEAEANEGREAEVRGEGEARSEGEGRRRRGGDGEGRRAEGEPRAEGEGRGEGEARSEGEGRRRRGGGEGQGEGRRAEGEPRADGEVRAEGEARTEGEGRRRRGGGEGQGEGRRAEGEPQAEGEPRGEGRRAEGEPRAAGEGRRSRSRRNRGEQAPEAAAPPFDPDITLDRPLALIDPSPEGRAEAPAPEDMSAGTGPEGHVPEDSEPTETVTARTTADGEADSDGDAEPGDRRKRRRKRRRGGKPVPNPEGPPERMCGLCAQKLSRVQPREQPCKVHGCSRTWTWDRASQMRAWVLSGSDDVEFDPPAPKRMCEVCREFCRTHPDREVACGRPGCANTWTFKTGAQLQAFLAGRLADPLKLCGECSKGEFAATFRPGNEGGAIPEGAETMPCVVPGCENTWLYIPGMRLRDTPYGELSPDRMCDPHRVERGLPAAAPHEAPEVEVTAADLATEEPHDHDEDHDEHEHDAHESGSPELEADEAGADEAGGDEAGGDESGDDDRPLAVDPEA